MLFLGNCYGEEWTSPDGLEATSTFASILQKNSKYQTFYAGKYLNNYDAKSVPNGWNYWAGLKGNSKYYNYDLNINGQIEHHGEDYSNDYLTDKIGQLAVDFLDAFNCQEPLLMVLGKYKYSLQNIMYRVIRLKVVKSKLLWL